MGFQYLENTPLEEALKIYINSLNVHPQIEVVDSATSLGRTTAKAVFAQINAPHYNASAMDGITLKADRTFGATETTPVMLEENIDFYRVDTGDPLPSDCNSVVMIEDVIEKENGKIMLVSAASPWQHVRRIGEDLSLGEMIVTSNTIITPSMIGAMLAGGVLKVAVWKKPVVGIIPTGDEIIKPCSDPKEGQIIEFNSSVFTAILNEWGFDSKVYDIVNDSLEDIEFSLVKASKECDVVLINAGSSAGREDYTKKAISECGNVFVHGISIKPGKPTILGEIQNKPVIGIPGYPVSGIVVMEKVVKKVLSSLYNHEISNPQTIDAYLSRTLMSTLKYQEFVRVKLGNVNGKYVATPLNRGAGVITSFVKADGILEVPERLEGLQAGTKVTVNLLRDISCIENTLVINGSHDMLIDIVADLVKSKHGNYNLERSFDISSSHVGSMGGIMALKRQEAHLAGIHLLDEATGSYNESAIKQYLSNEDIVLIKGVGRIQGFMYRKDSKYQFDKLEDLLNRNIVFVNRQKGSGTRILLDYLLRKSGLEPMKIQGYEQEEYTHIAVATQVQTGNADVGLGVYSAASAAKLEFSPIKEERYDFITHRKNLELSSVKAFVNILQSIEFRERLLELGGYNIEGCGEILSYEG